MLQEAITATFKKHELIGLKKAKLRFKSHSKPFLCNFLLCMCLCGEFTSLWCIYLIRLCRKHGGKTIHGVNNLWHLERACVYTPTFSTNDSKWVSSHAGNCVIIPVGFSCKKYMPYPQNSILHGLAPCCLHLKKHQLWLIQIRASKYHSIVLRDFRNQYKAAKCCQWKDYVYLCESPHNVQSLSKDVNHSQSESWSTSMHNTT